MPEPINDFNSLTHDGLNEVAKAFGVDFEAGANKNAKLSELAENGVTVKMWNEIRGAEELEESNEAEDTHETAPAAPAPAPQEDNKVLIKMTRFNNTYHIRGYQFSRQHPFALVTEDDADYLCRVDGGFSMATPGEAKEYYG